MKAIATKRKPSSTTVNGAKRPSTTVNRLLANPATSAARRRSLSPRLHPSATPSPQASSPPFDPALPLDGSLIVAEVLRDQFNALDDDIQTRATETALTSAVTSLNADIQTRTTEAQVNAAMNNAISTAVATTLPQTATNCNGVAIFDQSVPSFYDTYFTQAMVDKLNELIIALRRS